MTAPAKTCTSCKARIPAGQLHCLSCGAPSPTVGLKPIEITRAVEAALKPAKERRSAAKLDTPQRRAELQTALGGGYEVKRLIGRGGFGEVWAAMDIQLGRDIALKVLRPEISANPDFRRRFRREARAIARLRHPGIVPIYHVGESGGMVWFIMPLVEGVTLRMALTGPSANRPNTEEAVRILIEAADALREAHGRGIIHRDIKPENIMLEGTQRRVLLMDFGVAKVDEPGGGAEGSTEADMVFGSPEYMSPEQATARELDARSDVYSLGVVAYRMLAGRLPFDAETPREMLAHHVLSSPKPLTGLVGVPTAVTAAVMKCLAKTPDERWQSAEAFANSLAAAAPRASQLAATQPSHPLRLSLWPRVSSQLKALSSGRGLVLAALVLFIMGSLLMWTAVAMRQNRLAAAATGIAGLDRRGADSLETLAGAFARGRLTGLEYVAARDEVLASTAERIDETYGAAMDDSTRWPRSARQEVQGATVTLATSGAAIFNYDLKPSPVTGCSLTVRADTLQLTDRAPHDNCWFAGSGRPLIAPVEYVARFRVMDRLPRDAGIGLAWCATGGECRVAFVWPRAPTVWGAHRPGRGLSALGLGERAALTPGDHELRVRWQGGVLRARFDGRLVLTRHASADAPFLEHPASVDLVIQNTRAQLVGRSALSAVAARAGAP